MYFIAANVLENIQKTLTVPETGGILGVRENRIVTEFHHDSTGTTTERNYIPDIVGLNEVLRDWKRRGIDFVGFVHSHRADNKNLSNVDIKYTKKIKRCCGLSEILMLIYLPEDRTIHQYVL